MKYLFTFLFTLVLLAVCYPFLCMVLVNLHETGGLDTVALWYRAKNSISDSLGEAPILYVVGGSSAFWGIEAESLEAGLNFHVVNFGVHASLGLEYQMAQVKKRLKPGDKVLLAFESSLFGVCKGKIGSFLRSYIFTYDPLYLIELGPRELFRQTYGITMKDLRESFTSWLKHEDSKFSAPGFRGIAQVEFGERGDRHMESGTKRPLEPAPLIIGEKRSGALIFGTGDYSSARMKNSDDAEAFITIKKNEDIDGYRVPFNVNLYSSAEKGCDVIFDKLSFFQNKLKEDGIRVVIYDPKCGIVTDHFLYRGLGDHVSGRLYEIVSQPQLRIEKITSDQLVFTGKNAPKREFNNGDLRVRFTGPVSLVGWSLDPVRATHGCLVLKIRNSGPGEVHAGMKPRTTFGIVRQPEIVSIPNDGEWRRVMLLFEVNEDYDAKRGYCYLGFWANEFGRFIDIEDIELVHLE